MFICEEKWNLWLKPVGSNLTICENLSPVEQVPDPGSIIINSKP